MKNPMRVGKPARTIGWLLLAVGLCATVVMNVFTLAQARRAGTSVPYADEWALVDDIARIDHGSPLWPVLWNPYWGERQVIMRLVWLANAHYRALASLTWLSLLLQFVHIGLFAGIAWLLLGHRRRFAPLLAACVVLLNLLLSPFQMWTFTWSTQVMFALVSLAATSAFFCLSLAEGRRQWLFTVLAAVCAGVASLSMPNGLLVWPVLALESAYLKRGWRVFGALAAVGAFAFAAYLWHFQAPALGMGVRRMIGRPLQALLLVGLVVAGPIGFISNRVAAGVGVAVLAVAAWLSGDGLRMNLPERRWLSVVVANIAYGVLSAASIVAGRLDKRFLGHDSVYSVPLRFPTMVMVLWASIGLLAIFTCWRVQVRPALLGLLAVPFLYLMFWTARSQHSLAEDWADFFRGADALSAAFFLDAPDEQLLSRLWEIRSQRDHLARFLREHRLAMFHEPRATWIGNNVADVFRSEASGRCVAAVESTTPLDGRTARVVGWAWDTERRASPDYILLTDAGGRIVGEARGGLRHGYMPGLLLEPGPVPASHARFPRSEWLGYMKTDSLQPALVGLFGNQREACISP